MRFLWLISSIKWINKLLYLNTAFINIQPCYLINDNQPSIKTDNYLNMSCAMFLDILNNNANQNLLDTLKQLGYIFPDNTQKVILKNTKIINHNFDDFILDIELIVYLDTYEIIKSFKIDNSMFKILIELPQTIKLEKDKFVNQIQTMSVNQLKAYLIDYQFHISDDLSKLKITNFKFDQSHQLLVLDYLEYYDPVSKHDVIHQLKINFNDIQFLAPVNHIQWDVGNIIGIISSFLSIIIIIIFLIYWFKIKKKSKNKK